MNPTALTIAGSDPSGGAGIQADLKIFQQCGVYGTSAITLLTVQNTQGVDDVQILDPDFVLKQLRAILDDIPIQAAKTGALGSADMIKALAPDIRNFPFPLIVDPVMVSKHGHALIADDAVTALIDMILPHAFLITPNIHEVSRLLDREVTSLDALEDLAADLAKLGPKNILIKGKNVDGVMQDVLWMNGEILRVSSPYIHTQNTHGTGCVYSAAITANLAKGCTLPTAVEIAKRFVHQSIESNPNLGKGYGPVNFFTNP
jgi:hydroxymethylpyrimidine/phosphomethylpyrimidine kinase